MAISIGKLGCTSITSSVVKRSPQSAQQPRCLLSSRVTRRGLLGSRPSRVDQ